VFKLKNIQIGEKIEYRKTEENRKKNEIQSYIVGVEDKVSSQEHYGHEKKKTSLLISCCGDTTEAVNGLGLEKNINTKQRKKRYALRP
jgi:hypothetical protein